ncbi:hypothetical protein C8Q69DRAFT_61295 [Paecilomyces variotii]|uniref:GEgh 16 protein n=1 Tax=Byssochlamys spectabilis TaxID=264951 RepID=A0A443HMY2_BYSSP|nr:hypothetical protein C8Q69DRAFT_61295 [Paecilomyces variotii]KAJ9313330.1 hypothetical protein DTO271D3_6389 [Paecilomyces variotii]KAJ9363280.1 hypothetical protein DTO280E4_2688 [Paecilomyces variotii]RWQ93164.1 hypothetical protein C8Q69DRAFT_61295 [Paecilomyces variotii]
MYYPCLVALFGLAAGVHSHGVILAVAGEKGSPDSQGFLVNTTLPRNCINISPCQQDTTILRDEEMNQNIVNTCGRTELAGNVDVGQETEKELAANRVTSVQKGSTLAVTIHQVNADGAGPYTCDMDPTSNSFSTNEFIKLQVSNNVPGKNGLSQAKFQNFTMNVQLPDNLNCTGASTGNVCTIRCRNNALAGPFGGCFAVKQSDGTGRTNSTPEAITTAASLSDIQSQIDVDQQDIGAALEAAKEATAAGQDPSLAEISALATNVAATPAATPAASSSASKKHKGNNGNKNNNKANKGNNQDNQNNQRNQRGRVRRIRSPGFYS